MSTDRKVLKVMRKQLCAEVGRLMADEIILAARNELDAARNELDAARNELDAARNELDAAAKLREQAQRIGEDLAKIDAMLAVKHVQHVEKQQPQTTWSKSGPKSVSDAEAMFMLREAIPKHGGPAERELCLQILYGTEAQSSRDYKALADRLAKHPWPATPPELREYAGLVVAWLRDHP